MDNTGVDIQSVVLDNDIVINYVNGASETYPKNVTTYKLFHDKWLVPLPPFISDKFKVQMRNITLATINNSDKSIQELSTYFNPPNEEVVKNFFTYMRSRNVILPPQKQQWTNA